MTLTARDRLIERIAAGEATEEEMLEPNPDRLIVDMGRLLVAQDMRWDFSPSETRLGEYLGMDVQADTTLQPDEWRIMENYIYPVSFSQVPSASDWNRPVTTATDSALQAAEMETAREYMEIAIQGYERLYSAPTVERDNRTSVRFEATTQDYERLHYYGPVGEWDWGDRKSAKKCYPIELRDYAEDVQHAVWFRMEMWAQHDESNGPFKWTWTEEELGLDDRPKGVQLQLLWPYARQIPIGLRPMGRVLSGLLTNKATRRRDPAMITGPPDWGPRTLIEKQFAEGKTVGELELPSSLDDWPYSAQNPYLRGPHSKDRIQ